MNGLESAVEKLKSLNSKRVFIQYPEGLKTKIQSMSKEIESHGFETVTCVEPCFGACDIRDVEAERLGCDALLHIGHSDYGVDSALPVVYWEYFMESDPVTVLEKEFKKLNGFDTVGLVTSIQFIGALENVKSYLEEKGKNVVIHKSLMHAGQILGCDLRAATEIDEEVDCFLCITAGKFYGLGLAMDTDKPVLYLDLERGEISDLEDFKLKVQKRIVWNKSQMEDAEKVAILVSWKRGQLKSPFELKKKLESVGKEVYIFVMDQITPDKLLGLKVDAAVNMACPRIGMDDLEKYSIPIINFKDVEL